MHLSDHLRKGAISHLIAIFPHSSRAGSPVPVPKWCAANAHRNGAVEESAMTHRGRVEEPRAAL
jgi:hypothetical protein